MNFQNVVKLFWAGQDFITDLLFLIYVVQHTNNTCKTEGDEVLENNGPLILLVISIISSVVNILSVFFTPLLRTVGGCTWNYGSLNLLLEDGFQIGVAIGVSVKLSWDWQAILTILGSFCGIYSFMVVEMRAHNEEYVKNTKEIGDRLWVTLKSLIENINAAIPIVKGKHTNPKDSSLYKDFSVIAAAPYTRFYQDVFSASAELDREFEKEDDLSEKIYGGLSGLRDFAEEKLSPSYVKSLLLLLPPGNKDPRSLGDMEKYLLRISKRENWISAVVDGVADVEDGSNVEETLMPLISLAADEFNTYLDGIKSDVSLAYAKKAIVFSVGLIGAIILGVVLSVVPETVSCVRTPLD